MLVTNTKIQHSIQGWTGKVQHFNEAKSTQCGVSMYAVMRDDHVLLDIAAKWLIVLSEPKPSKERKSRTSADFVDEEFRTQQAAWLVEAGAVENSDVWETATETLVRKGKYTQEEADAYRKVDNINRRWREARLANLAKGVYIITSEQGARLATKEEWEQHTTPLEKSAGA
jgi:hypothetical protein